MFVSQRQFLRSSQDAASRVPLQCPQRVRLQRQHETLLQLRAKPNPIPDVRDRRCERYSIVYLRSARGHANRCLWRRQYESMRGDADRSRSRNSDSCTDPSTSSGLSYGNWYRFLGLWDQHCGNAFGGYGPYGLALIAFCHLRRPSIRQIPPRITHRLNLQLNPTGIAIDIPLPYLIKVDQTELSKTWHRIPRVIGPLRIFESIGVDRGRNTRNHLHLYLTEVPADSPALGLIYYCKISNFGRNSTIFEIITLELR